jgi:hypothetical protein
MWQQAPSSITAVTNIRFYVLALGTDTGNGRTPLLGAGAIIRCIPADWLDVTTRHSPYNVPHTTASSTTAPRYLHSLSFTPIYSNGTTPCPNLGPGLARSSQGMFHSVGVGMLRLLRFPEPRGVSVADQALIRIYGSTYARESLISVTTKWRPKESDSWLSFRHRSRLSSFPFCVVPISRPSLPSAAGT